MLPGDVVRITSVPYVRTDKAIDAIEPSAVPRAMYPHLRHVPWWRNEPLFRLSNLRVPDDRLTPGMKEIMMKNQVGDTLSDIPLVKRLVGQGIPLDNFITYIMKNNTGVKLNSRDRVEFERGVQDAGYIVTGPLRPQRSRHQNDLKTQRSMKHQHKGGVVYRDVPLLDRNATLHNPLLSPRTEHDSREKVCAYVHGRGLVVVSDLRKIEVTLRQSPTLLCYIAAMLMKSAVDHQKITEEDSITNQLPTTPMDAAPSVVVQQSAEIDDGTWLAEEVDCFNRADVSVEDNDDANAGLLVGFNEGLSVHEVPTPTAPTPTPVRNKSDAGVKRLRLPPFGGSIATAARQARIRAHLIQSIVDGSRYSAEHVHPLLQQGTTNHVAESAEVEEEDGTTTKGDVMYQLVAPMAVRVVQGANDLDRAWRLNAVDTATSNIMPRVNDGVDDGDATTSRRTRNMAPLHTGLSQAIDWLGQDPPSHTPGTWSEMVSSFVDPYFARPGKVVDGPVEGREGYAIAAFPHAVQHGEYVWLVRLLAMGEAFDDVRSGIGRMQSEYCVCAPSEVYRRKVQPAVPITRQRQIPHETLREAMLRINKPQYSPSSPPCAVPYFCNPISRAGKLTALERELGAEYPTNHPTDDIAVILQGCWVPQCYPSSATRQGHIINTAQDETNNNSDHVHHRISNEHDEPFYEDATAGGYEEEVWDQCQHQDEESAAQYGKRDRTEVAGETVAGRHNHHYSGNAPAVDVRMAAMLKEDRDSASDEGERDFNTMHHLLGALTVGDEVSLQERVRNRCRDLTERLNAITQLKDCDARLGFHLGDPRLTMWAGVRDKVKMFKEVKEDDFASSYRDPLEIIYPTGCEFRMGDTGTGDTDMDIATNWVAEEEEME